jgi:hypothetical protein
MMAHDVRNRGKNFLTALTRPASFQNRLRQSLRMPCGTQVPAYVDSAAPAT